MVEHNKPKKRLWYLALTAHLHHFAGRTRGQASIISAEIRSLVILWTIVLVII